MLALPEDQLREGGARNKSLVNSFVVFSNEQFQKKEVKSCA